MATGKHIMWNPVGPDGTGRSQGPGAPTFSHRPKHLAAQKMISAQGPHGPPGHLPPGRAGLEPP